MDAVPAKRHCYHIAPAWLVYGTLFATGVLYASERWRWFFFNGQKGITVLLAVAIAATAFFLLLASSLWALVFRQRFQFALRTLLAFVTVCALVCAWLGGHIRQSRRQAMAVAAIKTKLGAVVLYEWEFDGGTRMPRAIPPVAEPLADLLGPDFFGDLSALWCQPTDADMAAVANFPGLKELRLTGHHVTDAGLPYLEVLINLRDLDLNDTDVTDAGLKYLAGLPRLERLSLNVSKITDAGLAELARHTQLTTLVLSAETVTDAGMVHLAGLTQLNELWLVCDNVTDAGLSRLEGLRNLRKLHLFATKVTDNGVNKFQKALPSCRVQRRS
jgi:hypothetical protein